MIRSLARLAPLFIALAAVACGDDDDDSAGSGYACESPKGNGHSCTAITTKGATADQVASLKKTCTDSGNTAGDSCPTADKLGTCTTAAGENTISQIYYTDSGIDAATAKSTCESGSGTWAE